MDGLIQYSIPVKGLGNGIHEFDFHIDSSFFQAFEQSPVEEGKIDVHLSFEKRPELFVLEFSLTGTIKTNCDRCLESIDLPISSEQRLLVKSKVEEEAEREDDPDVVYVHPEAQKFDVAQYIYEYICLAIPMIKVYDCQEEENPPCNPEILEYLDEAEDLDTSSSEEQDDNPIWDALKNLDL